MRDEKGQGFWAPWVSQAMDPAVARSVRARLKGPADAAPRDHDGVRLTNVAHQFLAYWMEARGDKKIPDATDISLSGFSQLAPYVRYMHWEGERLVHRLWGSALMEGLGVDLTGTDMFDIVAPDRREADRARMRLLHEHPCGFIALARSVRPNKMGPLCEFLFLPVGGPDSTDKRIIGTAMWCEESDDLIGTTTQDGTVPYMAPDRLLFANVGYGVPELIEMT